MFAEKSQSTINVSGLEHLAVLASCHSPGTLQQNAHGVGVNSHATRLHLVDGLPSLLHIASCDNAAENRIECGSVWEKPRLLHILQELSLSEHTICRAVAAVDRCRASLDEDVVAYDINEACLLHLLEERLRLLCIPLSYEGIQCTVVGSGVCDPSAGQHVQALQHFGKVAFLCIAANLPHLLLQIKRGDLRLWNLSCRCSRRRRRARHRAGDAPHQVTMARLHCTPHHL
mmetsp:Transcript_9266/g.20737  ORF Transcript_9266/g.20737 Transcript_9266/m.20737 type:complete len:230 (-) Transcript_9266:1173-1862(-)